MGVPEKVAVPLALAVKVTPVGSVPVRVSVGAGYPVVVTVKLKAVPTVALALAALVMAGAWLTVKAKGWVAGWPIPFVAVIVRLYRPVVPAAGVPAMVAVPFPLSVKLSPEGNAALLSLMDGVGKAVVFTVKLNAVPTVALALAALVMAGAWLTVMTRLWVALVPTPLEAVMASV